MAKFKFPGRTQKQSSYKKHYLCYCNGESIEDESKNIVEDISAGIKTFKELLQESDKEELRGYSSGQIKTSKERWKLMAEELDQTELEDIEKRNKNQQHVGRGIKKTQTNNHKSAVSVLALSKTAETAKTRANNKTVLARKLVNKAKQRTTTCDKKSWGNFLPNRSAHSSRLIRPNKRYSDDVIQDNKTLTDGYTPSVKVPKLDIGDDVVKEPSDPIKKTIAKYTESITTEPRPQRIVRPENVDSKAKEHIERLLRSQWDGRLKPPNKKGGCPSPSENVDMLDSSPLTYQLIRRGCIIKKARLQLVLERLPDDAIPTWNQEDEMRVLRNISREDKLVTTPLSIENKGSETKLRDDKQVKTPVSKKSERRNSVTKSRGDKQVTRKPLCRKSERKSSVTITREDKQVTTSLSKKSEKKGSIEKQKKPGIKIQGGAALLTVLSEEEEYHVPSYKHYKAHPGTVICGICSGIRSYRFVMQTMKYGTFSCESCRKFIRRMVNLVARGKPDKIQCIKKAGECVIPKTGEKVRTIRCRACWLKICLLGYNVPPAAHDQLRKSLFPHHLQLEIPVSSDRPPSQRGVLFRTHQSTQFADLVSQSAEICSTNVDSNIKSTLEMVEKEAKESTRYRTVSSKIAKTKKVFTRLKVKRSIVISKLRKKSIAIAASLLNKRQSGRLKRLIVKIGTRKGSISEEHPDTSLQAEEENIISVTNGPKRGRPRKVLYEEHPETSLQKEDNIISVTNEPKRGRPRKVLYEEHPETSLQAEEENIISVTNEPKRGRPAKVSHHQIVTPPIPIENMNVNVPVTTERRGRPRKRVTRKLNVDHKLKVGVPLDDSYKHLEQRRRPRKVIRTRERLINEEPVVENGIITLEPVEEPDLKLKGEPQEVTGVVTNGPNEHVEKRGRPRKEITKAAVIQQQEEVVDQDIIVTCMDEVTVHAERKCRIKTSLDVEISEPEKEEIKESEKVVNEETVETVITKQHQSDIPSNGERSNESSKRKKKKLRNKLRLKTKTIKEVNESNDTNVNGDGCLIESREARKKKKNKLTLRKKNSNSFQKVFEASLRESSDESDMILPRNKFTLEIMEDLAMEGTKDNCGHESVTSEKDAPTTGQNVNINEIFLENFNTKDSSQQFCKNSVVIQNLPCGWTKRLTFDGSKFRSCVSTSTGLKCFDKLKVINFCRQQRVLLHPDYLDFSVPKQLHLYIKNLKEKFFSAEKEKKMKKNEGKSKQVKNVMEPKSGESKTVSIIKSPKKTAELRAELQVHGPRVKHVCRSASVALGQPRATFPTIYTESEMSDGGASKECGFRCISTSCDKCVDSALSNLDCDCVETTVKSETASSTNTSTTLTDSLNCSTKKDTIVIQQQGHVEVKAVEVKNQQINGNVNKKFATPNGDLLRVDQWEQPPHVRQYATKEEQSDCMLLEGGAAVITGGVVPVCATLCWLCGSKGLEEMLHCNICCEMFHPFCLDDAMISRPAVINSSSSWTCHKCILCATCEQKVWEPVTCSKCSTSFHSKCIVNNNKGRRGQTDKRWLCPSCLQCRSCGSSSVNHYVGNTQFCNQCFKLRQKGNFCPLCQGCYTDDDYDAKMLECGVCLRWIHASCEGMGEECYQILSFLPESVEYVCQLCCKDQQTSPLWIQAVDAEVTAGFKHVINSILKNKKLAAFLKNRVHIKDKQEGDQDPASQLQDCSIKEDVLNDNKDKPCAMDEIKSVLSIIKNRIVINNYNSVCEFNQEFRNIIDQKIMDFGFDAVDSILKIYEESFNHAFPWCNSEHKCDENTDSRSRRRSKTSKEDITEQASKPQPVAISLFSDMMDYRKCSFCCRSGEGSGCDVGRLLQLRPGEWVHVNCALWSAEVYEEVDGALQNVHSAVNRGKQIRCYHCCEKGASIGCCSNGCNMTYHFLCAQAAKCVFLEDKRVFCPSHVSNAEGKTMARDMNVKRTSYVDMVNEVKKWKPLPSVQFISGNLTVHCLGRLVKESYSGGVLVPIGYHCSRLFWSTVTPWAMIRYHIKTCYHVPEEDVALVEENIVVDHSKEEQDEELIIDVTDSAIIGDSELVDTLFDACVSAEGDIHSTGLSMENDMTLDDPSYNDEMLAGLPSIIDELISDPSDTVIFEGEKHIKSESMDENHDALVKGSLHLFNRDDPKYRHTHRSRIKQKSLSCITKVGKENSHRFVERRRSFDIMQLDGANDTDFDADKQIILQLDGTADGDNDKVDEPVRCEKCKRTYRTNDSFARHLVSCTQMIVLSGSDSDDDDLDDFDLPSSTTKTTVTISLKESKSDSPKPVSVPDTVKTSSTSRFSKVASSSKSASITSQLQNVNPAMVNIQRFPSPVSNLVTSVPSSVQMPFATTSSSVTCYASDVKVITAIDQPRPTVTSSTVNAKLVVNRNIKITSNTMVSASYVLPVKTTLSGPSSTTNTLTTVSGQPSDKLNITSIVNVIPTVQRPVISSPSVVMPAIPTIINIKHKINADAKVTTSSGSHCILPPTPVTTNQPVNATECFTVKPAQKQRIQNGPGKTPPGNSTKTPTKSKPYTKRAKPVRMPVAATPQTYNTSPQTVNTSPLVNLRPQIINAIPQGVNIRSQTVNVRQQSVSIRQQNVSIRQQNVLTIPQGINSRAQTLNRPQVMYQVAPSQQACDCNGVMQLQQQTETPNNLLYVQSLPSISYTPTFLETYQQQTGQCLQYIGASSGTAPPISYVINQQQHQPNQYMMDSSGSLVIGDQSVLTMQQPNSLYQLQYNAAGDIYLKQSNPATMQQQLMATVTMPMQTPLPNQPPIMTTATQQQTLPSPVNQQLSQQQVNQQQVNQQQLNQQQVNQQQVNQQQLNQQQVNQQQLNQQQLHQQQLHQQQLNQQQVNQQQISQQQISQQQVNQQSDNIMAQIPMTSTEQEPLSNMRRQQFSSVGQQSMTNSQSLTYTSPSVIQQPLMSVSQQPSTSTAQEPFTSVSQPFTSISEQQTTSVSQQPTMSTSQESYMSAPQQPLNFPQQQPSINPHETLTCMTMHQLPNPQQPFTCMTMQQLTNTITQSHEIIPQSPLVMTTQQKPLKNNLQTLINAAKQQQLLGTDRMSPSLSDSATSQLTVLPTYSYINASGKRRSRPVTPPSINLPLSNEKLSSTTIKTEPNAKNVYCSVQTIKKKKLEVSPAKKDDERKSIKIVLTKKGNDNCYTIRDITIPPEDQTQKSKSSITALKIKAKVSVGNVSHGETDVLVVPVIKDNHDNAKENNSPALRDPMKPHVTYEVYSEDGFTCQSDSLDGMWEKVLEAVQDARVNHQMSPLNLPPLKQAGQEMLGVTHNALKYLIEQLPGRDTVAQYPFKFHKPPQIEEMLRLNPSGSARSEKFIARSPFDMFGWLASKHRRFPEMRTNNNYVIEDLANRRATSLDLPMAMRFRHLRTTAKEAVGVYRSKIHGRGLFCCREIDAGEMVIEYAGEVIRAGLSDKRERYYEARGIGCYMFRVDDDVIIDATLKGNAARFINHSCDPNCYSRVVDILGKKHIIIFALRKIAPAEELTYDYKFPIEDDKIPCTCGSKRCRKYLN